MLGHRWLGHTEVLGQAPNLDSTRLAQEMDQLQPLGLAMVLKMYAWRT
jgi:hypothetical protein